MSQKAIDIIKKLVEENPHKSYIMSPELDKEVGHPVIFCTTGSDLIHYPCGDEGVNDVEVINLEKYFSK